MVQEAARGRDRDVGMPLQVRELPVDRLPAVQRDDPKPAPAAERAHVARHLQGEFAGRHEDEGLDGALRGIEPLDERDAVGAGLARSGLRLPDDVPARRS